MDEDNYSPYYPIIDHQRYPSLPPQNAEVRARPDQNDDLPFQHYQLQVKHEQLQKQYNQLQSQHNELQMKQDDLQTRHNSLQLRHSRLQHHVRSDPQIRKRISLALDQVYSARAAKRDHELEAPAANAAPVGRRRRITRISQKTKPVVEKKCKIESVVKGESIEEDESHHTPDREYAPSSADSFDEEMEDGDYEPTPEPVAPATIASQVTVAPHELKSTVKKDYEMGMPIYHRKESACCGAEMTREEFCYVKGKPYDAPQTLPTPDNNGNTQGYKFFLITLAERDRLDAWRIVNGRKPPPNTQRYHVG
ncbi:hypothetical protein EAE96_009932 [Botrytis aclada]|nr:hypothetical protein EAE96_009932 [Botrytis aclada]